MLLFVLFIDYIIPSTIIIYHTLLSDKRGCELLFSAVKYIQFCMTIIILSSIVFRDKTAVLYTFLVEFRFLELTLRQFNDTYHEMLITFYSSDCYLWELIMNDHIEICVVVAIAALYTVPTVHNTYTKNTSIVLYFTGV